MELSSLYLKSGLKNVGIVFLMTDAQVPSESFLVLINDMLSTGEIPELFPDDEVENIIAGVRNEVKFNTYITYNLVFSFRLKLY
jgi:dynein heavy chain